MELKHTPQVANAIIEGYNIASAKKHEFMTPEHMLAGFLKDTDFWGVIESCGRADELESNIYSYLNALETIEDGNIQIEFSEQLKQVLSISGQAAESAGSDIIQAHHMIFAVFQLEESHARFYLETCLDCAIPEFLNALIGYSTEEDFVGNRWEKYFKEMETPTGFTGRKHELVKIMRILCRMRKANVMLVGGRGVGKTAVACEAARILLDENAWETAVPKKLQGMRIMELDTALLLGGAQYRGDLEMRIKEIMEGVQEEGRTIIYIDELRSLGGNSRNDDGSKDILSLLTPYLKGGAVRCIVSATHEDIKRIENLTPGALQSFYQVDIAEPSQEECLEIIRGGIRKKLEEYHNVKYSQEICRYVLEKSVRYMADRCLPEKAIDLLDQAGATTAAGKGKKVTELYVMKAVEDICKGDVAVDSQQVDLKNMEESLKERIYGQDNAIKKVTEAILMSKAGLTDSQKTIGSFLFVGPTGVGKTELSKVLAEHLHVPLHRFDMSEYSEKHSVAKLIGSPAGYVGYDDGGILTDAIRKNPYCVLLLDEIEKAHEDIYNLLLQVMDYAVISDNKGRKVDFRNVILIMTSNAGARYAKNSAVGFDRRANAGQVMAKEVKNVFAPEFINRLTSMVVFNDLDRKMAGLILNEKIRRLQQRLQSKAVTLEISSAAYERLLDEGFSPEYGAREIERVVNSRVTPMLMREILFGASGSSFKAVIDIDGQGQFTIITEKI